MLNITNLKTEYLINPIGVSLDSVRFSWNIESDKDNQFKSAYQIIVKENNQVWWNSNKVFCDDTFGIKYLGKPLKPRTKYTWQVKVFTNQGAESDFSSEQYFETSISNEEWENAFFYRR